MGELNLTQSLRLEVDDLDGGPAIYFMVLGPTPIVRVNALVIRGVVAVTYMQYNII